MRQVRRVFSLISTPARGTNGVLCDLSAGSEYYTLAYAGAFKHVLHCGLSIDALNYADQKARALRIPNVVFLRIDYTNPPFRQSLDAILCFDTHIRREAHERLLLTTITSCLTPAGIAIVDFHNWWHNPLRRLGLLPQTFGENRSYRRWETEQIIGSVVPDYEFVPFFQEFDHDSIQSRFLSRIIQPTRLMYRLARPA
jgi:SAM-dependent methyltransferase